MFKSAIRDPRRTPSLLYWLFAAACVVYAGLSVWASTRQDIPFNDPRFMQLAMQAMELDWIKEDFWRALLYNHYQPPLWANIILGFLFILIPPVAVAAMLGLNITAGLFSFITFTQVLRRLHIRTALVIAACALMLFHPRRWGLESNFGYMSLSSSFLTLALWRWQKFIHKPKTGNFYRFAIPVLALTLLNTFFHFLWALFLFAAAWSLGGKQRRLILPVFLMAVLTLLVPFKNWVVFGNFASTSSSGIVFAQRVGPYPRIVEDHVNKKELSIKAAAALLNPYEPEHYLDTEFTIPDRFRDIPELTTPFKTRFSEKYGILGTFNYNYYTTIPLSRLQAKTAWWYFKKHPEGYLRTTTAQWINFFSSRGHVLDPRSDLLKKYTFRNEGGLAVRGILYQAGLLLAVLFWFRNRRKLPQEESKFILFVLINIFYSLIVGILVAFFDGSRYRYPFEYYYLLITVWVFDRIRNRAV